MTIYNTSNNNDINLDSPYNLDSYLLEGPGLQQPTDDDSSNHPPTESVIQQQLYNLNSPEPRSLSSESSPLASSKRPLSGRVTTNCNTLASSGNKVIQVLKRVIGNSEIAADSRIISQARQELNVIREEHSIPHARDTLLETIQDLSTCLNKARTSQETGAETLNIQGFPVAYRQGKLVVRENQNHQSFIGTDNSNFKGHNILLKNLKALPLDAPVTVKDLNPSITKLCTSIVNDKSSTFNGKESGIIVYVSPKSHPISTSMCDALSITEHWNTSDKEYELSRQFGWGYYLDQNKYKLAYDWIRQVKSEYIQQLQSLLKQDGLENAQREKIQRSLDALQEKTTSILKKALLITDEVPSELELQLNTLISIDKEFPEFEKTKLHSTLLSMQETARVFAQHKDVIARSVVKKEISVWTVSDDELIGTHPLVSFSLKLSALQKDVQALYPEGLDFDVLSLHPKGAPAFLQKHRKTHFDRNVGTTATSHSTVTDVVKENAQFKIKTIEKLQGLQERLAKDFPNDPRALEIRENCTKIIEEISNMYTEIQFYTTDAEGDKNEMPIVGFGLKEPLVKEAMSDAYSTEYPAKEREYNAHKADLAKTKQEAETLKMKLEELQKQTLTDLAKQAEIQDEIEGCKKAQESCKANITTLLKKIDHFEGVKLTRETIEECHKRNIPCFVHHGPS